jgi:DNA-binding transcriptional regulator YdaS (Cro superfamily)
MKDRRMQGPPVEISDGLRQAFEKMGGPSALARALGMTPQAISEWRRVPADRLVQIEAVTGVDRTVLRPDLYQRKD